MPIATPDPLRRTEGALYIETCKFKKFSGAPVALLLGCGGIVNDHYRVGALAEHQRLV